jgi:CheY-like chemotaxis protein/CHASE3 domain sensor protein
MPDTMIDADPRKLLRAVLPGRTLIGFVVALVAIVAVSAVSYRALAGRREAAMLVNETNMLSHQLDELLSTVKDAETGQRGYLLTGDLRYLQPYTLAADTVKDELAQLRKASASWLELETALIDTERLIRLKISELDETIKLRREGRTDEALEIVRSDRGKESMDALRRTIARMRELVDERLVARTAEWDALVEISTYVTWIGSAVLLLLVILAGMLTSRDFREQQRSSWLRQAEAAIAVGMSGEQARQQLGDNIAKHLARYLDAKVAAVYALEGKELQRIGSYGMPEPMPDSDRVSGLLHQVASDRSLVRIDDVPADYMTIASGLGRAQPRQLLLAPAVIDKTTRAVVELGLLRPAAPHDLELLRRVSEPIAIALRTARYRDELRDLLEETQRQAEELQTQQEELRVQNEELEQQTRALQDSQARLENQQTELEQINTQLEAQQTSLEVQRDDLQTAQREAQRASTYKSEFLANMSHELRTPLNSSLILAKLLMENRDGNLNDEQIKFAQTIYSAGNDLLTLINDILDLSKIEAGKLDMRPETITVKRMIDDLASTFRPIAKDKGLQLDIAVEANVPEALFSDPVRLAQILKNLLSNACKFTERGGVTLTVRYTGDQVSFDIHDTGIGIAPEQHGVIFEAFRQADGTTNRKYGGTGLGLSISRDLARLLGGELVLDSALGRGSTFTLTVPERYTGPGIEPRPAAPVATPARTNGSARPAPARPRGAIVDDRERLSAGGRTILVIEDDLAFATVVAELARQHEFQALMAQTAEEGLELARAALPSAIVLDVGLPDRSGLSVLDALKHDPKTRHIPVHMISATDYAQTALEMGAIGYAIKPVKRAELEVALQRLESKLTQQLRRVLVVEDDEVHRESTCKLLASDGVEVIGVGTAAGALDKLRSQTFDSMVLDLSLPDKTGFELLEEMANEESRAFPPVIVYTGRSLSRDEERRLRQFSQSIIIKGARSPERLLDEITLFLHQVEAELPADRQRMLKTARHREAVFEGRRILIVEDDVRNIFALSSVLEPRGAKIEIARNGREALDHLRDKPGVDLVLMDIMMPEMDGLQATREIRKQPHLARLPIIALTAKAMSDDRENCLQAGANDYIAKPLDVDKLLSLARVWMPK